MSISGAVALIAGQMLMRNSTAEMIVEMLLAMLVFGVIGLGAFLYGIYRLIAWVIS